MAQGGGTYVHTKKNRKIVLLHSDHVIYLYTYICQCSKHK